MLSFPCIACASEVRAYSATHALATLVCRIYIYSLKLSILLLDILHHVDIVNTCIASYVDIITICIASYVDIVYVQTGMILSIMYFINIIYFKLCQIMSHVLYVYQQKCYRFIITYYVTCLSCPLYV